MEIRVGGSGGEFFACCICMYAGLALAVAHAHTHPLTVAEAHNVPSPTKLGSPG